MDILTKDAIIIYIKIDENKLFKKLQSRDYFSREEYVFFCLNKRELIGRDEVLTNICEVKVDASDYNDKKCLEEITKEIMRYYGV